MSGNIGILDGQRAFVGLLARPLLTPTIDPDLHRQVTRNMKAVEDHARRMGYRVTTIGRVIRLVRTPIAGIVTAPPPPADPPSRHILALSFVLAAACEETTGTTTIAKLSELVSEVTNGPDSPVTVYDQARGPHRRNLLHAARLLERWGVLQRRLADDRLLENWADSGQGIGTAYTVNREALLLLTNPDILATVLEGFAVAASTQAAYVGVPRVLRSGARDVEGEGDSAIDAGDHSGTETGRRRPGVPAHAEADQWAATRAMRLLRMLVETPAVVYADLEPGDADMLRTMRGLRAADAETITGGHVEARLEGLVLILPDQHNAAATIDWPRAESGSWAALAALDEACRRGTRGPDGAVTVPSSDVDALTDAIVHGPRGKYLKNGMRSRQPARAAAEAHLAALGLLTVDEERRWHLSPVAARYRNPEITAPSRGTSPTDNVEPSGTDWRTP